MRGRPLRFLATVVMGWAAARTVLLWPDTGPSRAPPVQPGGGMPAGGIEPTGAPAPISFANPVHRPVQPPSVVVHRAGPPVALAMPPIDRVPVFLAGPAQRARPVDPHRVPQTASSLPGGHSIPAVTPPGLPSPSPGGGSRWSGSAWLIARDGGARALLSPLLGGAQGGLRIAYRLDQSGRTAAFARVAAPFGRGSTDLAIGFQFRPAGAPLTVYAEARRDTGSVAPAIGLFGGGAAALPGRWRLDAYGQAGTMLRDHAIGFADGQARVVRPLAGLEAGAGAWGAVQPNAARLDIGPTLSAPITTGPTRLRLSLDWRQRVAGNARPASGPVLSLGADF